MLITSPKNSRDKRLHVVFFTDASKTKSTSISLRNLTIVAAATALFFAAAGTSVYLYTKNRALVAERNQHIRELKSAIAAFAVTNEKNQIAMSSESDPQTELARKVAKEIELPLEQESKRQIADGADTLANLQSSLSSLSSVSASLGRDDKPSQASINFAEKKASSDVAASVPQPDRVMHAKNPTSVPAPNHNTNVPLTGVQVEQSHATEFNGQTTLHFQLVNTSRNRTQSWSGRVCGVVELSATNGQPNTPSGGLIAIPGGQSVVNAENPANSCLDGELVRFSKLRPTELVVPVRQDVIKRVTIFFVESGSNRVLSQRVEL